MKGFRLHRAWPGLSLIETLAATAVFAIITVSTYAAIINVYRSIGLARVREVASAVANEQIEIIRNLPYASIGTVAGIPSGVLPQSKTVTRSNIVFTVTTAVHNIDDPFDGTIGGAPNDTSPADYKKAEVTITCTGCYGYTPIVYTTNASPKNLESATNNGALFIQVFDANGIPIEDANVHIVNAAAGIDINDVTGIGGLLQIIDAPPGVNAYAITVTKTGYSTEQTYPPAGPPANPTRTHATVALQQVTQMSFAIDRLGTIAVTSSTIACLPTPDVNFDISGSKTTGINPTTYKYSQSRVTDMVGMLNMTGLEWDTYTLTNTDPSYDLAGTIPLSPAALAPAGTLNLRLIMTPALPRALLVTVRDSGTLLPLNDASVRLTGPAGYDTTLVTGQGYLRQTNWSSGSGQVDFTDPNFYFSDNSQVEINSPAGEVKLKQFGMTYAATGTVESSTFDTGSASSFYHVSWLPTDQPVGAGPNSVRFQMAAGNSASSSAWTYLGPDSTPWTYYTATNTNIAAAMDGNRYVRYKMFLSTDDTDETPNLAEFAFTFASSCVPPGQVLFNGLPDDPLLSNNWALTIPSPTTSTIYAVEMNSSTDGWAVGSGGVIARWNGTAWSLVTSPTTQNLYGVDCLSANDCWAAGASGRILRWNGTSWTQYTDTGSETYSDIEMVTSSNVWATTTGSTDSTNGQLWRWTGSSWSVQDDIGDRQIEAIECASNGYCWAVANGGKIYRRTTGSWSEFTDTGSQIWNGLSIISPSQGWVVGDGGAIYRFNGTNWTSATSTPSANNLRDVNCFSTGSCMAVGASGRIEEWNGASWSNMTSPTSNQMEGIGMISATRAFAGGATGVFIDYGKLLSSYSLTVTRSGYQSQTSAPSMSNSWQSSDISMQPN